MNCEYCSNVITEKYGSGRFCSIKCAREFSTKSKRSEINKKVSESLSERELPEIMVILSEEENYQKLQRKR